MRSKIIVTFLVVLFIVNQVNIFINSSNEITSSVNKIAGEVIFISINSFLYSKCSAIFPVFPFYYDLCKRVPTYLTCILLGLGPDPTSKRIPENENIIVFIILTFCYSFLATTPAPQAKSK